MSFTAAMTGMRRGDFLELGCQAIIRHRAYDEGVGIGAAGLDLLDLTVEIGVAAGFDDGQSYAGSARLFDHAVIDAGPVGIFQMGVRRTDKPRFGGLADRRVIYCPRGLGVIECRVPGIEWPRPLRPPHRCCCDTNQHGKKKDSELPEIDPIILIRATLEIYADPANHDYKEYV